MTTVGQVRVDGRWIEPPEGTKPTRWRARTKFRDLDGKLRDVERFDKTKAKAEAELKSALAVRVTPRASNVLRADMSVRDAGGIWLRSTARPEAKLAPRTVMLYRETWARYVEHGAIADLTLREANKVSILRGFLEGIADEHGSGSAKSTRSVVSLVLSMAVQDGVFDANAMREIKTPKANAPIARDGVRSAARAKRLAEQGFNAEDIRRDTTRALTRDERDQFLAFAATDKAAKRADVADLAQFMAGTGVRIAEALGQAWADIDLEAGTVRVRGTKTDASRRTLALPPWLVDVLTARRALGIESSGLVFPSTAVKRAGLPRDASAANRALRSLFDRAGFPWATPHSLRRTVASLIDDAGLSIALAANQLGHADPSMTARIYLGRKSDMSRAAAVL
ncbi:tyrosine-type recombinase/integrase [Pengzhenrongella sicca]|uniref:Site-specific integrase n=1 Tax=Pengzhenrongella sicca TaxID=2819238 RepID=A0A8A4ZGN5_9MICO|nr:site-specific integrase [Pengzhenrongella sicca]QTE30435.1 site-specific integrase [Pengzhenrongella sicca]